MFLKVAWTLKLSAILRVWKGHHRIFEPLYFPACPAEGVWKAKGKMTAAH